MTTVEEIAWEIVGATPKAPASRAIRELMLEYLVEGSQDRRVMILFDVLSCIAQDVDATWLESTEEFRQAEAYAQLFKARKRDAIEGTFPLDFHQEAVVPGGSPDRGIRPVRKAHRRSGRRDQP